MYEIEKVLNSGYVLFIDGQESACPFQPPMFSQSPMGAPQLVRIPCCTKCPLASIQKITATIANSETIAERLDYVTHCGSSSRYITVTVREEQKQGAILKSL